MLDIKIVLVGVGGVGKSAITVNYVSRVFSAEYDPTIEDSHRKQVLIDDEVNMLDILDTAGQEEYKIMQDQWFRTGEGFLVVYSVDNRKSFDDVSALVAKVNQIHFDSPAPPSIVLVANKCDLENRVVKKSEGEALAHSLGCPFFEVSAKEYVNIEESFALLVREVRKRRTLTHPPKPSPPSHLSKKSKRSQCNIL